MARTRSLRDALLVLVGALCMHLATSFFGTFQPELFSGDIIVNTQVNHHEAARDQIPMQDPHIEIASSAKTVDTPAVDVASDFPETTIEAHAPGWTVFKNLYMANGTLFIVTPHPSSEFPDIKFITSTGLPAENTPENIAARMPTAKDIDFLTPAQARQRWGSSLDSATQRNRVYPIEGNTFLFNDPQQFLDHYYHFCAELLVGAWAMWQGVHHAKVDPAHADITTAPPVTRAIFAHADATGWRDRPGFNAYFLRAAFPSLTVEVQADWQDRIAASAAGGGDGAHARVWRLDTVLLADRSAAFRGVVCGTQVHRTAGEAFHHMRNLGQLARWWWEPVRRAVLRFADVGEGALEIGVRMAAQAERGAPVPGPDEPVVVTYVNRQGVRRHLVDEDHERLVLELRRLCGARGWEFVDAKAELMTKEEQLALVSRTTVLLGVHGNGLTHLIMMSPTPVSTVIELFFPGGFAHDYEWTARALGHKHFAVWNDTYHTYPNLPWVDYPEGFQGTRIPVHAPTVAQIVEDRIAGRLP
ncbi:uncharacterized protein PHACADRAFT_257832 [Phanerochaete carnosa HHB-10118-sp]|uniref:Glycosyltransferase 61 catalytic domain-containing protein n=1 Tax=Phanerochaete carnosa (strain HHB-10118-sp) TaxID=650164 RepID=K5W4V2_PHACS|nr:uncharacterized protein PHACADRAFT_257832 [Phanerochaete carnosa HHB-10118-sp]EKM54175.1 hypothetical protein PHACADRAFT_257832 [Phanerochaete carnosa HHB-10118-sp]